MYQYVRRRRTRSSQRGDRQTRIPLRVSGCGPPQLCDVFIIVSDGDDTTPFILSSRWFVRRLDLDKHEHNDDDQQCDGDQHESWRRGRRCRGGSDVTRQKTTVSMDAREISQPRWCLGRLHDGRMADDARPVDDVKQWKRDGCGSPIGAEEARSPKSFQSRSSSRRARPLRNRTQPRLLKNRFYSTTGSQGTWQQTVHCWQDAFLSRTFASGIQVCKRESILYRHRDNNNRSVIR